MPSILPKSRLRSGVPAAVPRSKDRVRLPLAPFALAFCMSACGHFDSPRDALLQDLSREYSEVRSNPSGNRPTHPPISLSPLTGAHRESVRRALGLPGECAAQGTTDCSKARVWTYAWDAVANRAKEDAESVSIVTGQPAALVLEFDADVVSTAYWRTQQR